MFFYTPPIIPDPDPGMAWTDRGDKDGDDWDLADFTLDNTWREFDLSAIVGVGVRLVMINVLIRNTDGYKGLLIRTNGAAHDANCDVERCHTAGESYQDSMFVQTDADGKIEYKGESANWDLMFVTVRGWFN